MTYRIVTHAQRPELYDAWSPLVLAAWPEFMLHDPVCNRHWLSLFARFPDFQFYLYDDATDTLLGGGNAIPVAWDGTIAGLPTGVDDVLVGAFEGVAVGARPTALSALQAIVAPSQQGRGLSRIIIEAMREIASHHELSCMIAPVRPTWKCRYPLTPMERYVCWERDGLPLDPWMRVHRRLGAEVLCVATESMVITGKVNEWEEWTGLALPDSGEYIVPGALVPVTIGRRVDGGRYVEPNVWMHHSLRR
jgi:hypothetical protein